MESNDNHFKPYAALAAGYLLHLGVTVMENGLLTPVLLPEALIFAAYAWLALRARG